MRLDEVTVNPETTKLAALGQFLLGRNKDMAAKNTVSVETFVRLANQMGVNVTADSLPELAQQPPLNNIIVDIQDNQVILQLMIFLCIVQRIDIILHYLVPQRKQQLVQLKQ